MIIDGKELSKKYADNLKSNIFEKIYKGKRKPRLDIFLLSDDTASQKYVSLKKQKGEELGIDVNIYTKLPQLVVEQKLNKISKDNNVDGVMIQLPVSNEYDRDKILSLIPVEKDVDGLSPNSLGSTFHKKEGYFLSATAQGVVYMLEEHNVQLESKNVVIVNASIEIGLPLSAYFLSKKSTVQICNSKTKDLGDKTKQADIVISGTGVAYLIKEDMISEGSIVIDCGYAFINDKLYGDVDFDNVSKKTSLITPVPGGVGPMTIISLFMNTYQAYLKNISNE